MGDLGRRPLPRAALLGIDYSMNITKAGGFGVTLNEDSLIIRTVRKASSVVCWREEVVKREGTGVRARAWGLVEYSGMGY